MKVIDVKNTIDKVLFTVELAENRPPKLLSDNGSCYISNELAAYLQEKNIHHVRGKPLHPQTQGKIERYHRSMKNVVTLDNYFSPGQLAVKMEEFVKYYNFQRYHESLENLTPSDVYFGNGQKKLKQRKLIKTERYKQENNSSKKIN